MSDATGASWDIPGEIRRVTVEEMRAENARSQAILDGVARRVQEYRGDYEAQCRREVKKLPSMLGDGYRVQTWWIASKGEFEINVCGPRYEVIRDTEGGQ